MEWKDFNESIKELGNLINNNGYKPDIIIALARGGWVPTRYLSDLLHTKNIGSIGIKYEDETRTKLITYSKPSIPIECKKILLVEDMLESGKSIKWAYEYYSNQGYDVKTACLFIMKNTEFISDFYIKTIDEKIRFPWEEEKPN